MPSAPLRLGAIPEWLLAGMLAIRERFSETFFDLDRFDPTFDWLYIRDVGSLNRGTIEKCDCVKK